MNYKVGDYVRVREDLKLGVLYGGVFANSHMCFYAGKTVKIDDILINGYSVESSPFVWTSEMFECLVETQKSEFTKSDLKDGMVVEFGNGDRGMVFNGVIMGKESYRNLSDLNERLEPIECGYCIVKIYKTIGKSFATYLEDKYLILIWERK